MRCDFPQALILGRVITSQRDLESLCSRLATEPVIGVDTEYLTDRRFFPELCLIQVASRSEEALIDPLAGLDLAPVGSVFESGPVVVMHNVTADAPLLARATGCRWGKVFDTMIAAGFLGAPELSLGAVVQRYVGVTLPKGATLTDWSRRPLSDVAARYAEEDARHLCELWEVLNGQLEERGRQAWADDEVHRVLERASSPADPMMAWRRLDSSRRLRGVALAVAAEIAAWRIRTAMAINRPTKRVMSDLGVMAIAESKPQTLDALAALRGVDHGIVKTRGEEILDAVGRALALDPSEWPPRSSAPPADQAAIHDALGLMARVAAHDAQIASWLAYEREDLVALTARPPAGRLVEGWRAEVLAPPLLDFLNGKSALSVVGRRLRVVPVDSQT
jgi:ribonuclease D